VTLQAALRAPHLADCRDPASLSKGTRIGDEVVGDAPLDVELAEDVSLETPSNSRLRLGLRFTAAVRTCSSPGSAELSAVEQLTVFGHRFR